MNDRFNNCNKANYYSKNTNGYRNKNYEANTRVKPNNNVSWYRGQNDYRSSDIATKPVAPVVMAVEAKIETQSVRPKVTYSRESMMKLMNIKTVPKQMQVSNLECIDLKSNNLRFYKQIKLPEENMWIFGTAITKLDHHSNGYVPPNKRVVTSEEDVKKMEKDIRGVLNKMTPENFELCLKEITNLKIDSEFGINCLVDEIFLKASLEPSYSSLYARFCASIGNIMVGNLTFKSRLLKKCQAKFLKPLSVQMQEVRSEWLLTIEKETDERMKTMYIQETEEKVLKSKDKYFGNLRFISELYLQKQLGGNIILKCLNTLLTENFDTNTIDGACIMLPVCGSSLDTMFPNDMQKLITEMTLLSKNQILERKTRFKLMDIIEMRGRNWQMRGIQIMQTVVPKTLNELKEEKVLEVIPVQSNRIHSTKSVCNNSSQQNIWRPQTVRPTVRKY